MSDSEEEAAFASADEGEGTEKTPPAAQTSKNVGGQKVKEGVGTGGGGGDTKTKEASAEAAGGKDDGKKGKGKQQQQNKKRGNKKGNQPQQKEEAPKANPKTPSTGAAAAAAPPPKETKKESPREKTSETSDPKAQVKGGAKDSKDKSTEGASAKKSADTPTKPPVSSEPPQAKSPAPKDTAKADESSKETKPAAKVAGTESTPERKTAEPVAKDDGSVKKPAEGEEGATKQAGDVRRGLQSGEGTPGSQDIPRGQRDHTPQQEDVLTRLGESTEKPSGGGWGWSNWGTSLLSAASNSVQTFTHQVGDGFSTIIESVESSLGVPDPEEVAKAQGVTEPTPTSEDSPTVTAQPDDATKEDKKPQKQQEKAEKKETAKPEKDIEEEKKEEEKAEKTEEEIQKEEDAKKETGGSWFSSWGVADIAKKVQNTGKSLASKGQTLMSEGFDAVEHFAAGGIDVLENIGKKTYNTLSEHDPAFRKTREYLRSKGSKPNLSGVLREARDKAEKEAEQAKENEEARKAHFGTLFDDYQGIAHLEALEMLSNQSEKKVHSLLNSFSSEDLTKIKPVLISIKEAFEVNEDEEGEDTSKEQDFSSLVGQYVSELQLGTAPDKLNKVHDMVKQWIVDFDSHESHESDSIKEVHQKSIQALAELTAKGVEQFHKAGELVLLERDKDKDCTERAHSLARLTGVLCHEIGNLSAKFADCLNKMAGEQVKEDEITPLVTNVYLEATNSSTYLQDAFQLLLPVLQHAALEHSIMSRES